MSNSNKISTSSFMKSITVDIPLLKEFIQDIPVDDVPLNIIGPTGIGKTEIIKFVCKQNNWFCIDLNTTCSDVLDVGGLPFRDDSDRLNFALSHILPLIQDEEKFKSYEYVILFIDELPLAGYDLQSVLYKLVQERLVRDVFLHQKVRIISAGNLKTDLGNHNEPPAPLKNREQHVYLAPDAKGWLEWAVPAQIHPTIVSFIQEYPQYIHVLANPDQAEEYSTLVAYYAFYTPRSWTNLSTKLYRAENSRRSDRYKQVSINGCVGTVGAKFWEFYQSSFSLPKVDDVIKGKAIQDIDHWLDELHRTQYSQALLNFLIFNCAYRMKTYADKLQESLPTEQRFNYFMNATFNMCLDHAFEFIAVLSGNDSAKKKLFYQSVIVRFNLMHDITNPNSVMTKFVNSDEMRELNDYKLKINKVIDDAKSR